MQAVEINKVLSCPHRIRTLLLLEKAGELCVCELSEAMGSAQTNTSRYIAQLKRAGLCQDRREGKWVFYRISDSLSGYEQDMVDVLARYQGSLIEKDLLRLEKMERLSSRPACPGSSQNDMALCCDDSEKDLKKKCCESCTCDNCECKPGEKCCADCTCDANNEKQKCCESCTCDNCECKPGEKCCADCTCDANNENQQCCESCTCENCECKPGETCCADCTCGHQSSGKKCCETCQCGDDCQCTEDNKCCDSCTCFTSKDKKDCCS